MTFNFLKQPLLHFLLIGAAFFLIYHLATSDKQLTNDLNTVIVDKNSLLNFMQTRSKKFNQGAFEKQLENMSGEELQMLIDEYVREEVLYREALGLGMDKDDYVIKRRMVQKIEFIHEDMVDSSQKISEQDIKDYFNTNLDDYKIEPSVTFTHVFFSKDKNGYDEAMRLAGSEIEKLNSNKVGFPESVKYGDRFLYHLNYVEKTPEFVENHFGKQMTQEVFNLEPSDALWYGPFESSHGFHLVMLANKAEERVPELEEVYDSIVNDLTYSLSNEAREKSINEIIDSYDIKILYKKRSNSSSE